MAVLETPWFMKTKTSDLGRINKVFDERYQANVAQIETKQRKSMIKLEEEIKNIKVEFRHIRSEVDFSTDIDDHGNKLDAEKAKRKSIPHNVRKRKGAHFGKGSNGIPPGLEKERQRYLQIIGRNRRKEMTMVELREMCHNCVKKESSDEASRYINQARLVLFPKPKRAKKDKKKERKQDNRYSKYTTENASEGKESPDELPIVTPKDIDIDDISVADRSAIRSKSASSSGRAKEGSKPPFSRVKSLHIVNSSDLQTSLGIMTSVSV